MSLLGHRSVVLVIFYTKDGKILLSKRLSEPFKGSYDSPGGKVEPDEPLNIAIQREVREETGIIIDTNDLIKGLKMVYSISGLSSKEYIFSDLCLDDDYYHLTHYVYIYPFYDWWTPARTEIEKHEDWGLYSEEQLQTLELVPLIKDNLKLIYLNINDCLRKKIQDL